MFINTLYLETDTVTDVLGRCASICSFRTSLIICVVALPVLKIFTIIMMHNYFIYTSLLHGPHSSSLVPRPSRSHANIIREIFYMHQNVGRSGRFYAVMMMSPGRGLARPGRGLDFLDTERYLPTRTVLARGEVRRSVCSRSRALNWAGVDAGLRSNLFSAGLLSLPGKQFR